MNFTKKVNKPICLAITVALTVFLISTLMSVNAQVSPIFQLPDESDPFSLIFPNISFLFLSRTYPISFTAWGNRTVGGITIEKADTIVSKDIYFSNSVTLHCTRQIDGTYFSVGLGNRILPLSTTSLSNLPANGSYSNNLTLAGGLYTSCTDTSSSANSTNPNSLDVVGFVTYFDNNNIPIGTIVAGTTANSNITRANYSSGYIPWSFRITTNGLSGNLYDSTLGAWYVDGVNGTVPNNGGGWWGNNRWGWWNNGSLLDSLVRLIFEGNTNISKNVSSTEKATIQSTKSWSLLYSTDDATVAKIFNLTKKNASEYCRWVNAIDATNTSIVNSMNNTIDKVICFNGSITITKDIINSLKGRDLIVMNGNATLSADAVDNSEKRSLSLFVQKWHLYITMPSSTSALQWFNEKWFPVASNSVTNGVYLLGNYIVNGLVMGVWNTSIPAKTFIHGTLVSLNTISTVSLQREGQIDSLFSSNNIKSFISLSNVFTRSCNSSSTSSNTNVPTVPMGNGGGIASIPCGSTSNLQQSLASLIVIKKNIPSLLFK